MIIEIICIGKDGRLESMDLRVTFTCPIHMSLTTVTPKYVFVIIKMAM